MTRLVSIEGVCKSFGGRMAVSNVGFEIAKGEIFGLLGHNGAGKSTTFGVLLGLVRPDRGSASIGGHCVSNDRARAMARTGAIFESPAFYDYLSGWHNLRFLVSLSGQLPDEERIREVVGMVGLSDRIRDHVRTYSHGMRQRLGLAQALLPNPDFLVLDEPTNGLDPVGIREMRELILDLRERLELTVLLSSHLLPEVEHLCDRVAILHRGQMIFCGEWAGRRARWRFDVEGPCGPLFEAAGLRPVAGQWEVPADFDSAAFVARLVASGCKVREAAPVRQSLEDFYMERIGE
jgi:ABC-2 type transport system ATP-binding protein